MDEDTITSAKTCQQDIIEFGHGEIEDKPSLKPTQKYQGQLNIGLERWLSRHKDQSMEDQPHTSKWPGTAVCISKSSAGGVETGGPQSGLAGQPVWPISELKVQ